MALPHIAHHLAANLHMSTTRAIKRVYTYSSYLAMVPLDIDTLSLSWKATLICAVMYFIDAFFAVQYMRGQFQFDRNKMMAFLVPKVFRTVEAFLQMVTYTIILNTHLFSNAKLKFILTQIGYVDTRLSHIHGMKISQLDDKLTAKIHAFFIFFFISSFVAMTFRHLTVTPYSAAAIFGFFLPHFQPYAITAQFIVFLDVISNRIDAINGYIKHLKQMRQDKNVNLSLIRGELSTLACVHNDLCDICLLLNKYFSVQILLVVACHFLSISVAAYSFLSSLGVFFQSETVTIVQTMSLVLHTMLWVCQRFAILILTAQATIRAQTSLELFTSNVEQHEVEFFACGFFPIDYSMIYMIIGAATTYWVILVQLQSSAFTTPQGNSTTHTSAKPILTSLVTKLVSAKQNTSGVRLIFEKP
ncbi:hypothetical protein WDU94_004654 [Cyamophila willieti]